MRRVRLSAVALAIPVFAAAMGYPVSASAKLVRLEIASKQTYGTFRPGEFVFWQGRITGEL